ncbi:ATP-dependent dethiobiotin synthetase BioD [Mesorhizobium sp. M3A.F.Ca.ET.201.01.1.1]|uniref:dethiobiotin synthase n=1 Tax=Mesorhizobium sp. M3A.F.Ca.ET.201.01.1.1 TaxID=2563946 RepID=UPI0010937164|nr:dethiobiotin synthase [Mesorhizobium sp. M3A.F.Ca.ET.201.01.1.1]TGS60737.1 ATP-dependent dethiobiotin synthetase BioD [Mesorhizobium sp. M3A.F.Ca.ET.201.01.1.1]
MAAQVIVTGADIGIGKTVFAAGLTGLLDGAYWQPVQPGAREERDSEVVSLLAGLRTDRVLPEAFCLNEPLSPRTSVHIDGVEIDVPALALPATDRPLVVEGGSGLMVPLNKHALYIDVLARWNAPVVLCAGTDLCTISHTLLSLEALRVRSIPVLGVAFIGERMAYTQMTVARIGQVRVLGRLPHLASLMPEALSAAMRASFNPADFLKVPN